MRTPYLTPEIYRQAPTGVETEDIVTAGTMSVDDIELLNVIDRASTIIDSHCSRVFSVATTTERALKFLRAGWNNINIKGYPVKEIKSVKFDDTPITQSNIQMLDTFYRVWWPAGGNETRIETVYVNGYLNTVLVSVIGSIIYIEDTTGFKADDEFLILGEGYRQACTVTQVGVNNVTVNVDVSDAPIGSMITQIPADIQQACIHLVTALLKSPSSDTISMIQLDEPVKNNASDSGMYNDLRSAHRLLQSYRRPR